MSRKLTIRELAPYLPYGLKMTSTAQGRSAYITTIKRRLKKIEVLTPELVEVMLFLNRKPILRPLSDFSGKRIARDVMQELNCSIKIVQELWDFDRGDKLLEEISYGLFVLMCENHIDFNKLIEKGLAIDINTIKE